MECFIKTAPNLNNITIASTHSLRSLGHHYVRLHAMLPVMRGVMPVNKILGLLLAFVMLSSEAYACQSPPMPTEKNKSEFFSQVHIFAKKHHDSVIVDVSFPSTYKGKELLWVHMGSDSDRKSNNFHTRMHVENNVTFSALVGESLLPEVSFNFTYGSCGYAFVLEGREVLDGL